LGYQVHLRDLMPLHIEQAIKAADAQSNNPLASAQVGDALTLDFADASADVVLLLGPLYHLTEHADRVKALREAYRVLKPGGVVLTATISRFASFLDGLHRGFLADDYFAELVERDLIDGQHRNPKQLPGYFATAYFHHPDEIAAEVAEAGFSVDGPINVEGPAGFTAQFDKYWNDDKLRERLLAMLRTIEREPTMIGARGHLITVGQK
jgi:ubiquinone/menaquinone biosynthesis C-methylase UbiE